MTPTSPTPRARMVDSAARMMRERGVTGVGLRQIAADAQGPRGSLQRYFPGGKTQVMTEALEVAVADFARGTRDAEDAPDLPSAISSIVGSWRQVLSDSDFAAGCPIAAVVVDVSESVPLREQAHERFTRWRAAVARIHRRFGYDRAAAWDEAALVVSAIEGAALVARAGRSIEPLDAVERLLVDRVRQGSPGGGREGTVAGEGRAWSRLRESNSRPFHYEAPFHRVPTVRHGC